ncbi:MAG: proline iminopeptidase-family hydrolase [Acidobacteriota bacterium]
MKPIGTGDSTQEGYIDVTGGKVWYRIVGAGARGVPLLVIHGGPGAPHDYLEPLKGLADERPVIFYDQLGCGNSDRPEDTALWTVERFVGELEQVRSTLGLDRVHLLGQSWGSMLAVEYTLEHPQGVASLVLSAPYLSTPLWEADQRAYIAELPPEVRRTIEAKEAAGDFASPEYQEAMTTYYKRHLCRLETWPECMERTFAKMGLPVYEHMFGPSEFSVRGTLKHRDLTGRLKEIRVPVLFTCGRQDEATPATTARFQASLPGSEMIVFEEASHMHHLEKTGPYLEALRNFLHRAER